MGNDYRSASIRGRRDITVVKIMEPNPFLSPLAVKIPPRIVQECRDNPARLTNIAYREGYSSAGLTYHLARQMEEREFCRMFTGWKDSGFDAA